MKRSPLKPMSKKRRAALPERAEVRQAVLERDDWRCQFWATAPGNWPGTIESLEEIAPLACGGPLDCHEIIPRSAWPEGWLVVDNVVTVCRRHHDWIGDHPDLAHKCGLHGYSHERPA